MAGGLNGLSALNGLSGFVSRAVAVVIYWVTDTGDNLVTDTGDNLIFW